MAATLSAMTVAGTMGLVALAPTANAGEVSVPYLCKTTPSGLQPDIAGTFPITVTVPAEVEAGSSAPVKLDFKDGVVGEFPAIAAGQKLDVTPKATVKVSTGGAASPAVTLTHPAKHFEPVAGDKMVFGTFTGNWAVPAAAGAYDFAPDVFELATELTGTTVKTTTTCTPTAAAGVSATSTVKEADPTATTLTVSPAEVEPGRDVTLGGTNWPASGTAKAELCAADGTGCAESGFSAQSPAIDADGKLTGTATVAADKPDGDYQVKVTAGDKSKTAALTVKKGGTTPPPGGEEPMEPRMVNVAYKCVTPGQGEADSVRDITVTVPKTGAKGDSVDVRANFKDDILGQFPDSLPIEGVTVNITPKLTLRVSDGKQWNGSTDVVGAGFDVVLQKGGTMKGGPLNGKWSVPGGGMFSFTPDVLVLDVKLNGATAATTTCTPTKAVEVSAQLKATGDPATTGGNTAGNTAGNTTGNPGTTGQNTTGDQGTSGASGGDLAKTGSGGSTVNAFALAAGTAVLAAVAVLLVFPYRRRTRARG